MGKSEVNTALRAGPGTHHGQHKHYRQHNQYKPRVTDTISGKGITGFWRLYEIDRLISQGYYPNCSYLAEHLEVHRRTVERDIERLRDLFAAPIHYDRKKRGYCYTEPFSLPPVRLREGEAIALFLGVKLCTVKVRLWRNLWKCHAQDQMLLPQEVDVSLERARVASFHVDPLRGRSRSSPKLPDIS